MMTFTWGAAFAYRCVQYCHFWGSSFTFHLALCFPRFASASYWAASFVDLKCSNRTLWSLITDVSDLSTHDINYQPVSHSQTAFELKYVHRACLLFFQRMERLFCTDSDFAQVHSCESVFSRALFCRALIPNFLFSCQNPVFVNGIIICITCQHSGHRQRLHSCISQGTLPPGSSHHSSCSSDSKRSAIRLPFA